MLPREGCLDDLILHEDLTTYEFEFRWCYYQEKENGSKGTGTSYSLFFCSDASF